MNSAAIQPADPALTRLSSRTSAPTAERPRFGATLGGALGSVNAREHARDAAEEFVAIAFVEPVLSQIRESNHAAAPFGPSDAEKSFGPLLDAEIARRIVAKERYGLVDAVARQLQAASGIPTSAQGLDTHG
jgi:Rod binding domain-containing protein